MLRIIKPCFLRLIIILIFISVITSCQNISDTDSQAITIPELSQQPIGQTTVHTISFIPSSGQINHWKSFTNINWITQISLDRKGNIWTAGRGGMTLWNPQNGVSETFSASDGIPGNYVTALAIGADNKIWLGTYSGLVVEYANSKFTTLQKRMGDTISSLAASPDGILWIGTNRGVYRFDGNSLQNYSMQQGILDNYIQSIAVTSQGTVWVGVMGGVSFFNGKNWKSKPLTKGEFISNIVEAPDKTIWLTSENSLIHYDGAIWTTYPIEKTLGDISAITISPQGAIWLGSMISGLIRFDEKKQHFIKYPFSNISSMTSDPNGNLWMGTYDSGIAYFDGRDLDIYKPENTPVNNFVTSSALSSDGSLWFGTFQGLSKYDGEKWQSYTTSEGVVNDSILSLAASPDGSVWIGTENGVSNFDGKSWKNYNSLNGLPSNRISSIAVTRNGTVWLVSMNNLYQFDGSRWNLTSLPANVPINSVSGVTVAADGSLWVIATSGILRFDENNWVLIQFPNQGTVACLEISNKGDIWIGTRETGIVFLDGKLWSQAAMENVRSVLLDQGGAVDVTTESGSFSTTEPYWRTYTKKDGLLSNTINKIAIAEDGEVWVATDSGISNLNTDNKWINYTEQSGLGNDFVQTLVLDRQGRIWVGMPLGGISEYVP
jgi:ligand-binding sensor domain-containing protein